MRKITKTKKTAQSLIEYGLILALVSIIAIGVLQLMGKQVNKVGENAANTMNQVTENSLDSYCESIGQGKYDPNKGGCSGG